MTAAPDPPTSPARGPRWAPLACAVALALGAVLLAWGSFGAGPVSDDAAALGYVHRMGPFADVAGPQYDLRTVRFWRPLVTATLGLQEAVSGPSFTALRLFNLACHLASAILLAAIARRLGAGWLAGFAAGALALAFPWQGGTVTWIVGRVDSQCLPLVLGAGYASLAGRPLLAAAAALAALATKESGAAAPLVAAALLWARGDDLRGVVRGALPTALAIGIGLVLRRLALGEWIGGYPLEVRPTGGSLPAGLIAAGQALGWVLLALPVAVVLGVLAGRARLRAVAGAALASAACLLPLTPLLAAGELGAVHRRWVLAVDALLCLALVLCFARPAAQRVRAARVPATLAGALVLLALLVQRGGAARTDVARWTAAAALADAHEARARAGLAGGAESGAPVLDATFPRVDADGAAYVAQWGVADRFRAPFEPTPRPVWPWRPLFEAAQSTRDSVTVPRLDLRWPPGEAQLTVPPIQLDLLDAGAPREVFVLDDRLLADAAPGTGPELIVWGDPPAPRIEFVLFTELGYGTGVWADAPPAELLPPAPDDPDAIARHRRVLPLRTVLLSANREGMPLYHVLRQAADLGATVAYLELRAVDDERGRTDRPIAASRWVRLEWGDALRRELLPL